VIDSLVHAERVRREELSLLANQLEEKKRQLSTTAIRTEEMETRTAQLQTRASELEGRNETVRGEFAIPGSDLTYYRIGYQGNSYIPLTSRFVLSLSADLGYGDGYGDLDYLPFWENYYAGGPRSVRGYVANSLGPRETLLTDDPVGGNVKVVGSIELMAAPPLGGEIEKTVRVGLFFDVGNVWVTQDTPLVAPTGFNFGEVRYSTGIAASWLSPVGALTLSMGWPLNSKPEDETQIFQFGIGQTF
jgi:outer membrane protein insertion porin family